MVHRRELDGQEIVLGNQGALWGNAMTWWDHETGSVWSQPIGEAILGPRTGAKIDLLPSSLSSWESWRVDHPQTIALDAPPGRSGFALGQMVIVVEIADEVVAYPVVWLREVGVVNDVVAGVPIAVTADSGRNGSWAVFSRRLDSTTVELDRLGTDLVDRGSGSTFDPVRGLGRGGPLSDQNLDLLPGVTAFPRDVATFWPNARLWEP